VIGILMLLEATRRALGLPMVVVAVVFLAYTFGGPYMPDLIAHKGASLSRAMSHQWLTTEGVFGVALGVSSGFIFLFVLFGSLLDRAGAGNYFIKSAFALLGHMRGGPAKAAVVSSAATGIISGSSIANVVTTGTFTIPLMKRVGYRPDQAGAVEVSSSVNGQIMPPVMGAAAFLMVEYVGIPYTEVIKHAFLPAPSPTSRCSTSCTWRRSRPASRACRGAAMPHRCSACSRSRPRWSASSCLGRPSTTASAGSSRAGHGGDLRHRGGCTAGGVSGPDVDRRAPARAGTGRPEQPRSSNCRKRGRRCKAGLHYLLRWWC
jgi:hypothetical protein